MIRNMHTHDDTRPKRPGLRLAAVVASAVVAGGIIVPASAAVAAPMPRTSAVSLVGSHSMHAPSLLSDDDSGDESDPPRGSSDYFSQHPECLNVPLDVPGGC
ncbi:hypothetical protein BX281_0425 [Streptomyces sp. Ag82_O1-15]|uniref:hypothetical protein n=1 Tax=Streptomyces sp. Ag82_O1-15 TaxID=1938855 RepID=UPI000BDC47BD|nr:hypothetical protein [Streptomyces sp. Ag82_O1-15]PBC92734.1 hypothetical protein BX281_0425 [Streptomyces sp. Ag82_O1-15]